MLLLSVSFSAAGFLGIAAVAKPVEPAGAPAVGSAHPRAGACRPLHGHPRARAQGGEAGEGPPAVPPCRPCPCPSRGAPQPLRASGEGLPNPPPQAGAGGWVFRHVSPPTAGTIRAPGQVARLPATCPPLRRMLLRMGQGQSPALPM